MFFTHLVEMSTTCIVYNKSLQIIALNSASWKHSILLFANWGPENRYKMVIYIKDLVYIAQIQITRRWKDRLISTVSTPTKNIHFLS